MPTARAPRVVDRTATGTAALTRLPPSRALRVVVPEARNMARWEGGSSAPGHRNPVAAFGPAPAAPVAGLELTAGVSLGAAPQRDAGVEGRVEQVHDQIDHHERGHEHQRDALDHGEVLGLG